MRRADTTVKQSKRSIVLRVARAGEEKSKATGGGEMCAEPFYLLSLPVPFIPGASSAGPALNKRCVVFTRARLGAIRARICMRSREPDADAS